MDKYYYTIRWRHLRDKYDKKDYWGVDTQTRTIYLFNVRETDYDLTEYYLEKADKQ